MNSKRHKAVFMTVQIRTRSFTVRMIAQKLPLPTGFLPLMK